MSIQAIGGALLCTVVLSTAVGAAESADRLIQQMARTSATSTEASVAAMLKAALEEQKENQAHAAAQGWFRQNVAKDADTLRLAAEVAERSAHYPAAVAFYQQYLAKVDPRSKESQHAVMRLYRLMIDVMGNESNAAYFYLLNHAERFMPHGAARQYNTWLLDEAWAAYGRTKDMQDFVAVLAAVYRSGYSRAELEALYDGYLVRVRLRDGAQFGTPQLGGSKLGEACIALGKAITHDEGLRLLMTWTGEIWRYNALLHEAMVHNAQKGVAPKAIPVPPLAAADAFLARYPDAAILVWRDMVVDEGSARKWLMTETGQRDAKVALVKKYVDKVAPAARSELIHALAAYDASLLSKKQLAMQGEPPGHHWPRLLKDNGIDTKAPEAEVVNQFRRLLADYESPTPKVASVDDLLVVVSRSAASTWPMLLENEDRLWILLRVLKDRRTIHVDPYRFDPAEAPKGDSWEPHLRRLVQALSEKNTIVPWLTAAWVSSCKRGHPGENADDEAQARALFQKLRAMPAYAELPSALRMAARHVFGAEPGSEIAAVQAKSTPRVVFAALLALKRDADVGALKSACGAVLERLPTAPTRVASDADSLNRIDPGLLQDPQALALVLDVVDNPTTLPCPYDHNPALYDALISQLKQAPDSATIQSHAAALVQFLRSQAGKHKVDLVAKWLDDLVPTHPAIAATLARASLNVPYRGRGLADSREKCNAILNRANITLGIRAIAVDESDPAYPIYKSQSELVAGNEEAAWQLFKENMETAVAGHRSFSAEYWLWVLERLILQRDEAGQKRVVTMLQDWRQDAPTAFSIGQSIMLDVLYGDIARKRGGRVDLENALKVYRKVAENPAYAGTPELYTAILRTIDVQRLMKDYTDALQTADQLIARRVPELWARARYAKSEVYYDMEAYDDARELVDEILAGEPNHEDAKILQGKVLIKQQSLVDATEIDIVSEALEQQAISPGQWLSVNLTDPTLEVGGGEAAIEVEVWADSGDRETILLAPFGDSKTKFRGKVRVRLGPAIPGDGEFQVIGDDKVYYAYSKAFIDKVKLKDPKQGGPLTVVSDGLLMASTRKLLSVAEQKQMDAQAFAAALSGGDGKAFGVSSFERVRPGNPIYIRVVDEDRSRSGGLDHLSVKAEASSGDRVEDIVLTETDPYSGIFEGKLQTSQAQATVFATSTRPGLNPNMVISPKPYGAWKSAPGRGKQIESLTVDLNDNVALETFTINASEPGFAPTRFRLLAGTSRDQLDPVTFWPSRPLLADPLSPAILVAEQPDVRQIVRHQRGNLVSNFGDSPEHAYDRRTISAYLTKDYLLQGAWNEQPVSGPSDALNTKVLSQFIGNRRRKDSTNVACRFRAHFYEETLVTRGIAVAFDDGAPPGNGKQEGGQLPGGGRMPVYVTVNGQPLAWNGTMFSGDLELQPGLHRVEIFFQGSAKTINDGRPCTVWMRDPDNTTWIKVPESRFDPSTFPEAIRTSVIGPARIEATKTPGEWKVHFGKGARARLLVLELVDFEGPEAAVKKLTLTSPGGKQVLPVPTDYQEVRKNDLLEITSGDTIWIRYEDDRFVSKAKARHERLLHAGYANAGVAFAEPKKHDLLRFRHTDRLPLLVSDGDMDVSEGADTVKVTLTTRSGSKATVELVEGDGGRFVGAVQLGKKGASTSADLETVDGDVITMSYWDQENENPGVPCERRVQISHAVYAQPKMVVSDMVIDADQQPVSGDEKLLVKMRPVLIKPDGAEDVTFVSGLYSYIDIIAPHLRIHEDSTLMLFVQTETGRKLAAEQRAAEEAKRAASGEEPSAAAISPPPVFDVTVPGTRLLLAAPAERTFANYTESRRLKTEHPPLDHYDIEAPNPFDTYWHKLGNGGTFRAVLGCWPGTAGAPGTGVDVDLLLRYATGGTTSPLSEKEDKQLHKQLHFARKPRPGDNPELELERCKMRDTPIVMPGERVYIGFRYEDDKGQAHWLTATAKTAAHGMFSAVAERGGVPCDGTLLFGDRIRVQVKDLGFDTTDAPDTLQVRVSSKSGATYPLVLKESGSHSGDFSGAFNLVMRVGEQSPDLDIALSGFPATYSDTIRAVCTDSAGRKLVSPSFTLGKGADGLIETFTKQYGDDDIAIRTQFAMAESYLEVAKDLRKLKQDKEAAFQYEIAKQLLMSTMDRFTDPAAHAHAEYLLGDLAYEEAGSTEDRDLQNQRYLAALARFSKVTANYPESEDAPKAQFKRAITYERLNEPDSAAQEYVKLAYMYPDSEYLAVAMYRLGVHFRAKAGKAKKELVRLKASIEGKDPKTVGRDLALEISQVTEEMSRQHIKAGNIFGRLVERFPTHPLRGEAGLRSAQCYYAAEDYSSAIPPLKLVIEADDVDGKIRAEALYWCGKCFQNMRDNLSAYAMFIRCTEDFPETEWSGFSLAELATPGMQEFEKSFLRDKRMREAQR